MPKEDRGGKSMPRRIVADTAVVSANAVMMRTSGLRPESAASGANGNSSSATASTPMSTTKARRPSAGIDAQETNNSGKLAGAKYLDSGGTGRRKKPEATQAVSVK